MDRPALSKLAQNLYEAMERLDPSDGRTWLELNDREREFYELSLLPVLESGDDLAAFQKAH